MRIITTLFLSLALGQHLQAQLIKSIGSNVKKDLEYKADRKVREKVDTGIDSLTKSKKNKDNKQNEEPVTNSKTIAQPEVQKKESSSDAGTEEGYITLFLSSPYTTKGLPVTINGESIRYKNWSSVELEVKAPDETTDKLTVPMTDSGNYRIRYEGFVQEGEYIITATSSNGKSKTSKKIWVSDITQPDDGIKDLMEVTGEAFNRLKARGNRLKGMLSAKNSTELESKIDDVRNKYEALKKFLVSLDATRKDIADLAKAGRSPSRNIRHHISHLNQMLAAKTEEIRQINKLAEHEPFDNTICEYIVMLNEACAAFSTITNFFAASVAEVIRNIILDKVVPKATEVATPKSISSNQFMGDEVTWGAKEATKIFATAKFDAEGFATKLGKAEFAADVIQFATDVLLKAHCGIYKGILSHSIDVYFRNDAGVTWWKYGYKTEAAFTLRYPLNNSGLIKMKGNVEGNAISFSFAADPEKNPDYVSGTAGKVQTMIIRSYTPLSFNKASSLNDGLGFGMLARLVVTPAYFNIPIDAEYNTETEKIKLYINEAIADFPVTVYNRQFMIQWAAGLPKLRIMDYPISQARLTLKAGLKEQSEFNMEKDSKGNPSFSANVNRTIGTKADPLQHIISVNISARKE